MKRLCPICKRDITPGANTVAPQAGDRGNERTSLLVSPTSNAAGKLTSPHLSRHYRWSLGTSGGDMSPPLPVIAATCVSWKSRTVYSLMFDVRPIRSLSASLASRCALGMVSARPVKFVTWPYHLSLRLLVVDWRYSCCPMFCLIILRTSSLVTWSV